jgi:hypothetical protein
MCSLRVITIKLAWGVWCMNLMWSNLVLICLMIALFFIVCRFLINHWTTHFESHALWKLHPSIIK